MKKNILKAATSAICLLGASSAQAADLSTAYALTRAEWLELKLQKNITYSTDLREIRVGVNVLVFKEPNQVLLLVGPANGETPFTSDVCFSHRQLVEGIAAITLERYTWASDIEIVSRCV